MKKILAAASVIWLCGCSMNPHNDKKLEPTTAAEFNELNKYWILTNSEAPKYPKQYLRGGSEACVNIKFVVGEDGRAHDMELLEMWPMIIEPYIDSAKSAISKLRFSPSITNSTKSIVSTSYVTTFFKPSSVDPQELKEVRTRIAQNCRLNILSR